MNIITDDAEQVRVRVLVAWDAKRGYHVALPTASMLPGTFQPVTPGLLGADGPEPATFPDGKPRATPDAVMALSPTVEVLMPARDANPMTGKPSAAAIRLRYEDHPVFAREDYAAPVALTAAEAAAEMDFRQALDKAQTAFTIGGSPA